MHFWLMVNFAAYSRRRWVGVDYTVFGNFMVLSRTMIMIMTLWHPVAAFLILLSTHMTF
jgi:hypothetical protein